MNPDSGKRVLPVSSFAVAKKRVQLLYAAIYDGTVSIWDLEVVSIILTYVQKKKVAQSLQTDDRECYSIALDPETDDVFATVGLKGCITLNDIR